ncbi:TetR/AcrR family transcriptional regulator [Dictyobacter aurantiacus]|uniref:TetR family transcriptional regulator n=1 Tax=Dictyobacter aurantiacus TaxID=1936993 RepID=A0A401ZK93_9CHLR|nr:TetR/AcrR family transcriptional regulator [Dictyobacter aurantiacus]GCE07273.1 TetR family transcriptional regulator [Dictyobacter aurantiacus]
MQTPAGARARRQGGEKRKKTRDLILEMARRLFNEQGEANVTLAHIGEQVGISEGNVWYHFHTKHDLIIALFAELQARAQANQQINLDEQSLTSNLRGLLVRGFQLMWEYRFLFRDHINWASDQHEVYAQLITLTNEGHNFIERVLERMRQAGLLQIEPQQIPLLATNIWIINRYWIDYCQSRHIHHQITEQEIQAGIEQVRALIHPYLMPAAHHLLASAPNP